MTKKPPIQYSCYFSRSSKGEQFVPEHTLVYIISGSLVMADTSHTLSFNSGDIYFCRRNNLVKYTKCPPETGEYKSISIYFDQHTLRNISLEYGFKTDEHSVAPAFQQIPSPAIGNYMRSLLAYETILTNKGADDLLFVKQKEVILLLLKLFPALKNILFDFSEPGKIDLEAFMEKNYHFNVQLKRYAYLTGRSLATFKRDFEKIYHTTPSRWLLQRRLREAYHLIKEMKKAVSDIYLELGFEDLSHFSYAFKKVYGVAPSKL
ncbi:MAG TPA: AraC family transcriptional regulator [Mucilaginibacter sp.]|jgi:AraC-like DNA-binding protein|nr:AraC family transcriptional regulator [Mucilaginibacter sp.]